MFIKICGITRPSDALRSIELGADAIGFVAYPKSKRYVTASCLKDLLNEISSFSQHVKLVGVFVNAETAEIIRYIESGINVVQLHGDEDNLYIYELMQRIKLKFNDPIEIWKAFRPRSIDEIRNITGTDADKILLDSFSKASYGGTGKLSDWNTAAKLVTSTSKPVILAGGLNFTNIKDAFSALNPYGYDFSSGVESAPGIKDNLLLEKLFDKLNSLEKNNKNYER